MTDSIGLGCSTAESAEAALRSQVCGEGIRASTFEPLLKLLCAAWIAKKQESHDLMIVACCPPEGQPNDLHFTFRP